MTLEADGKFAALPDWLAWRGVWVVYAYIGDAWRLECVTSSAELAEDSAESHGCPCRIRRYALVPQGEGS